jgi:3-hydroxyacyl-CoA dehydrogenase/enoyl-CoA hydratase/3-hydroxybutyryl-CoA epimerase
MPLLEVIQPPGCSQETVHRALALGKALGKTNILVNDGYGFFTTRLFAAYLLEGCQLVAEGHDPVLVEFAARTAGMLMPPLKVFDEVSLTLGLHAFETREAVTGEAWQMKGLELVRQMVELGRLGRANKAGFYDWEARTLWPGLRDLATGPAPAHTGLEHLRERLMVSQAAEVARVLADGVIADHKDVEVGAILGLGFAPNTGGPLAWMDRQGLAALVPRMQELARLHGPRYAPTEQLVHMAQRGQRFWPEGQLP